MHTLTSLLTTVLLCSCAIARDGRGQLMAAGEAGSQAAAAIAGSGGGPAAGSGGGSAGSSSPSRAGAQAVDVCRSSQCDGTGLALEAYCKLEHARCPSDMAQAHKDACANTFAVARQTYPNACGGESLRVRYAFGSVEFYFDGSGKLGAVTTLTNDKGGACNASFYRYGDQRCAPAGKDTDVPCE